MTLYIALLNCILAIIMAGYNWRVNRNILFLSLLILIISSYIITHYVLVFTQSRFWISVLYANPAPLWYLPGPLLYLYVRGTLEDRVKLKRSDLIHLIPFVVSLIGILPYLFTSYEYKLQAADAIINNLSSARGTSPNWMLSIEANLLLRPILMIGYAVFSIIMVWRAQLRFSHLAAIPHNQWIFSRNWLLVLSFNLIVVSIGSLLLSYYYVSAPSVSKQEIANHPFSYVIGISLVFMPFMLILFPQILYGVPRSIYFKPLKQTDGEKDIIAKGCIQTLPSDLSAQKSNYAEGKIPVEDPFLNLSKTLLQVLEEKKPFLKHNFSLDDLAEMLDVPKHHLYYCFQNVLHTKFTRLRTEYRIQHAKRMLKEVDLRKITLDAVGRNSGFASRSAFYNTFKSEVGCSPGDYAATQNKSGSAVD